MNKRNRNLVLLLLLLAAVAAWYFYPKKKNQNQEIFTQQGQTEFPSGNIVMKVWDHDAEDGDTIQVFFNGKMLADSLAILNQPVEYRLGSLKPGEYWIGIKAINEGATSPASAYVRIMDTTHNTIETWKEFSMDAWKDSAASWKLIIK